LVPAAAASTRATSRTSRRRWLVAAGAPVLVLIAGLAVALTWRWRDPKSRSRENRVPSTRAGASSWSEDLASTPALAVLLKGKPEGTGRGPTRLALRLEALIGGAGPVVTVRDGDRLTSADHYFLTLEPITHGHIYVFQVDSRGKLSLLHPATDGARFSTGTNPAEAGLRIRVPSAASGRNLRLDENTGVEHVFCILSQRPWLALERELAQCETRGGPEVEVTSAFGTLTRGVGGFTPAVAEPGTETASAASGEYRGNEGFLVVGRWFRHESTR
jgi:hypothetical protein